MKREFQEPQLSLLGIQPRRYPFCSDDDAIVSNDTLIMGFDSEYVSGGCDSGKKNFVISYQTYSVIPATGKNWFWAADMNGARMTLRDIVVESLKAGKKSGQFHKWPSKIMLVIHFSLADLTAVSDFEILRSLLDGVRKTFISLFEPLEYAFHDDNRNRHKITVKVRDSKLLAPATGGGLNKLGETIKLEKIEVEKCDIKDLRPLKARDSKAFWEYAMRDSEIAAIYFLRIVAAAQRMLGTHIDDAITVGSLAPKLILKVWKKAAIDRRAVLGLRGEKCKKQTKRGVQTFWKDVDLDKKAEFDPTARRAYYGARNEAYWFGLSPQAKWLDLDLHGAYVTGMGSMGLPRWNELRVVQTLDEMVPEVIGVAHISFRFPDSVRFPCIPVRAKTGLIFPRTGKTWATAPEIWLARQLGATVELSGLNSEETAIGGFVLEMDFSVRPFEVLAKSIHEKREEHQRSKPMLSGLYKQIGNSVYGKISQAIRPKRVFDTRVDDMKDLEPSAISNAFIALQTTALIRAVMGEILTSIPPEYRVISCTTDGFITDFPEERVEELCGGRIGSLFQKARRRICGESKILEIKHRPERVLCFRTRGQATLNKDGQLIASNLDENGKSKTSIILAKGGINTKATTLEASNEEIVNMFVKREPGRKYPRSMFRGFREIYEAAGTQDLNKIEKEIGYTLDFDWKRKPTITGECEILGTPHLWFDTVPMERLEEYEQYRKAWPAFVETTKRVLKTESDLKEFMEFMAVDRTMVRNTRKRGNAAHTTKKAFLRAYTQQAWGIERKLTNAKLMNTLTSLGYPTTINEVENAQRGSSKLLERCVAETPDVIAFLTAIQTFAPDFPSDRLVKK